MLLRVILILILLWAAIFLGIFILNGSGEQGTTISFQQHDTYFVTDVFAFTTLVFVVLANLGFFVYQFFGKWKNRVVNVLQLLFLGVFNFAFIRIMIAIPWEKFNSFFVKKEGWTIYPPLSAMPKTFPEPMIEEPVWQINLIVGLLILLPVAYFIYSLIKTIKSIKAA